MAKSLSINPEPLSFDVIYDIVKRNDNTKYDLVYRTLLTKSEYLTLIPDNDNYSILHYLVMYGLLDLFNKVIAIPNIRIILLTKTATKPAKDILQISRENQTKSSTHKKLYELIENLDIMDKFVEYAKNNQINECKRMLQQNEDLVNLKPPYRKYYLIHHLAYANNKDAFDQLLSICNFDMKLLTNDNKTASEVALEQKHTRFATYLESLSSDMRTIREKHDREKEKRNQEKMKHDEQIEKQILTTSGSNMLDCFTCPLTKELFQDPVVLSDGFTYERSAIQKWLDLGNRRSPMTNIELTNITLEKLFKNERRINL
ncbi:unnamed protein product [Rotaria sp. Silwood1]|nr:unnamed protein product [Rotaria sp. Silwood1]